MSVISFPVEEIRQEFMALQKIENGHLVTYLDAASGTQVAKSVVDAMAAYMKNGVGNENAVHGTGREVAALVFRARDSVAQLIGANKGNIIFNGSTSAITMLLSFYVCKIWNDPEANIVLTEMNQGENKDSWEHMAIEKAIPIHYISFDSATAKLNLGELEKKITSNTKLVVIDYSCHITGMVHDLEVIIKRAKDVGAIIVVNATYAAASFSIDFEQMGIDVLLFSAHHMFGPHLGIAVISDSLLEQFHLADIPIERLLESGATNYEALVGITEMVQFIASIGEGDTTAEKVKQSFHKISMYEAYLMNMIKQAFKDIPFVRLHDGGENVLHTPIIAFTVDGLDAKMVSHYLAQDNAIHVDYGMFGKLEIIQEMTADEFGVVRISLAPYNTEEEIEGLISAVGELENRMK